MNHQNLVGNGCTLEDCHTNVFALADLAGIKWRRLKPEVTLPTDLMEDPVLWSFTHCVHANILCAWQRVRGSSTHDLRPELTCTKELWIFWYGERPNLDKIVMSSLQEVESGSWDTGMSYECRTLLFKALHDLIERSLVSHRFVRVGKWFVQPYDHRTQTNTLNKSAHLSFRFTFFLHGRSTVCASVDVRQLPPLWRLHPYHLTIATSSAARRLPVLLLPYGLSGVLTGQHFRDDSTTIKILDDWKQFFVVPDADTWDSSGELPKMLEVIVGGVRMRYPASYILVTGDTEASILKFNGGLLPPPPSQAHHHQLQPSNLPLQQVRAAMNKASTGWPERELELCLDETLGLGLETSLKSRTLQDLTVVASLQLKREGDVDSVGSMWDFGEFLQRNPCTSCDCCGKSLSVMEKPKDSKEQAKESGKGRRRSRRALPQDEYSKTFQISDKGVGKLSAQQVVSKAAVKVSKQPATAAGVTPATSEQMSDSTMLGADLSPHSGVPSPMLPPQLQPPVNPSGETTMPTLSPQPRPSTEADLEAHAAALRISCQVNPLSAGRSGPVSLISPISDDEGMSSSHSLPPKTLPVGVRCTSVMFGLQGELYHKPEGVKSWVDDQAKKSGLKRPLLSKEAYEEEDEEDLQLHGLYDYSNVDKWLDLSVKCRRLDSSLDDAGLSPVARVGLRYPTPTPKHDPYEFSDESSGDVKTAVTVEPPLPVLTAFEQRKAATIYDASPGRLTLTRDKDLVPKYDDLDNIFASSDSDNESEDTMFVEPTPPASVEDLSTTNRRPYRPTYPYHALSGPSQLELTKMFPTPPSLEHQPHDSLSPEAMHEIVTMSSQMQLKSCHSLVTPLEDLEIIDYSYVYKPPVRAPYASSRHYFPIELPSHRKAAIVLKEDQIYRPQLGASLTPSASIASNSIVGMAPTLAKQLTRPLLSVGDGLDHTSLSSRHSSTLTPPAHSLYPPSVERLGSVDSSPAPGSCGGPRSVHNPRTPLAYGSELTSPASNSSLSYVNLSVPQALSSGPSGSLVEVNSAVVNAMLYDSLLNIFKDHNFDSCTLCVCNMNIRGADVGLYLPDHGEPQFKCTCGFSAIVNRRYVYSGLFYEDYVDITGARADYDKPKPRLIELLNRPAVDSRTKILPDCTQDIVRLLQGQFATVYPSLVVDNHLSATLALQRLQSHGRNVNVPENLLEQRDAAEATLGAMEVGRQAMDSCANTGKLDEALQHRGLMHDWPFLPGNNRVPLSSIDVTRLLHSVLPLLEDAINKKRSTRLWEQVYRITGPLSWKDFHLLSGRSSDETSEPQPIPAILTGLDKDWGAISPHSLQFWDKLCLEPYGKPRDIAYVVVCPDNDFVIKKVQTFFTQLSQDYELCRLGKHRPIAKTIRNGILRVGRKHESTLGGDPVDEWFTLLGDSPVASRLKLYAQVCRYYLSPFLNRPENIVRSEIFSDPSDVVPPSGPSQPQAAFGPRPNPSPVPNTLSPSPGAAEDGRDDDRSDDPAFYKDTPDTEADPDPTDVPTIVVYLVDPFSFNNVSSDMQRLAMLGLLRVYYEMLRNLNENLQDRVYLQLIPLQSLIDLTDSGRAPILRSVSLSVYAQCRRLVSHAVVGQTLTGFGPAASAKDKVIKSEPGRTSSLRLYSPPCVLAPLRNSHLVPALQERELGNVLFCAYCLSEDQKWLLAVVTDTHGELLETATINIYIPERTRRRQASSRRIGLNRLWDFLLEVITLTNLSWRLVIGRFGRIGHGELQGWASLLSARNLTQVCTQLRESCAMCGTNATASSATPFIQSACLVSLEMHPTLQIMHDSLKMEERQSSRCPLTTPADTTVTHILVMPTSATATASHGDALRESANDEHHVDNIIEDEPELDDAFPEDINPMGDFGNDLDLNMLFESFNMPDAELHSHVIAGDGHGGPGHHSPTIGAVAGVGGSHSDPHENRPSEQPLAIGYYVSTAKTGPLPRWMWATCPHKENMCPVCFRAALHVNMPSVSLSDDPLHAVPKSSHPLASKVTCDVLRYVLEMYNALSWLNMDTVSNERRSCLPIHMSVLMQLYHAMSSFV